MTTESSEWPSPPPMREQVREALDGASKVVILLLRHAALCRMDTHTCSNCRAIVEVVTGLRYDEQGGFQ